MFKTSFKGSQNLIQNPDAKEDGIIFQGKYETMA
jgi:hypothetical protein